MNKKLKRFLIIDLVLLILVVGGFYALQLFNGLQLNGEAEMTVNLGEEFEDPGVKSRFAESSGEVDTNTVGDYTIEYTLREKSITRTVHVVDPSRLVLGLKGSAHQIVKKGDPFVDGGAFAINKKSGALEADAIKVSGKVDTKKVGDYEVTYSAESDGIKKDIVRTVSVVSAEDFGKEAESVPVMMYHWIYSDADKPEYIDGNWIKNTALEEHLKYLSDNNYYYPSWKELRAWLDGEISLPEKSIILSFDDGKKAFYENGIPLFEQYQVPVTSFLIGWEKNWADQKVRDYACEYIDFENHTYAMHQAGTVEGHRGIIANMSEGEQVEDFAKCQAIIKNNDALAYPYGDYTDAALDAVAEQGFLCAFTTENGKVKRGQDYRKLPRVRVFGDSKFSTWQQSIS